MKVIPVGMFIPHVRRNDDRFLPSFFLLSNVMIRNFIQPIRIKVTTSRHDVRINLSYVLYVLKLIA